MCTTFVAQKSRYMQVYSCYWGFGEIGAGDGIRTHDIQLGKLTLYP
jgi:hypothetical protein